MCPWCPAVRRRHLYSCCRHLLSSAHELLLRTTLGALSRCFDKIERAIKILNDDDISATSCWYHLYGTVFATSALSADKHGFSNLSNRRPCPGITPKIKVVTGVHIRRLHSSLICQSHFPIMIHLQAGILGLVSLN